MAISVKRAVGRDSSGRIRYSGTTRVGFRSRSSGGGFERVEGGEISTERGSLIRERLKNESQEVKAPEPVPEQTVTQQPVASTVGPGGRPSVIKQTDYVGGFSTAINGRPGTGTATYSRQNVVGIAGAAPVRQKVITGAVQPTRSLPFTQRVEAGIGESSARASQSRNPFTRAQAINTAFAGGLVISGVRTAQTARAVVTQPRQVATSIGAAGVRFARDPAGVVTQGVSNVGASIRSNPARAAGIAAGDIITGRAVDRGLTAGARSIRFAGKTERSAEGLIAPSYLRGEELFPTGTPRRTVAEINRNRLAFSASPVAPNRGRSFTVLTQAEKRAAGLDLSETGGLYAAARVSPAFTQQVVRGESRPTISLVPSFGVPGSIAAIETRASRLPASVRSEMARTRSIAAGNRFIDGTVQRTGTNRAFSSPATELPRGIAKTEAEVIIPGGSVVERKGNFGFISRTFGRDFDEFVRVPVSPGSSKTVPVAIRKYTNLGIRGSDEIINGVNIGRRSRTSRVSDIEYYRAARPTSSGALSFARFNLSSSLFGSSSRASSSSLSFAPSSSLSRFPSSSISSRPSSSTASSLSGFFPSSRTGYRSSEQILFSSAAPSRSRASSSRSTMISDSFFRGIEGGGRDRKKRNRDFRKTPREDVYASSLTAGALRIRARRGERRSAGFTGLELRGI